MKSCHNCIYKKQSRTMSLISITEMEANTSCDAAHPYVINVIFIIINHQGDCRIDLLGEYVGDKLFSE